MQLCTPITSEMLAFSLSNKHAGRCSSSLAWRTRCLWFTTRISNLNSSMMESCRWVMQCHPRGARRPRASNKCLLAYPLRTEISPVSLNLLMMLCTVNDEICKSFTIWCWVFFLSIPQYFYALFHRLESLCPSLLLRDSASLRHPFYS